MLILSCGVLGHTLKHASHASVNVLQQQRLPVLLRVVNDNGVTIVKKLISIGKIPCDLGWRFCNTDSVQPDGLSSMHLPLLANHVLVNPGLDEPLHSSDGIAGV